MSDRTRYLVLIWNDIEPKIIGPFDTDAERDRRAGMIRHDVGEEHGLFLLDVGPDGTPSMDTYSGGYLDELVGHAAGA